MKLSLLSVKLQDAWVQVVKVKGVWCYKSGRTAVPLVRQRHGGEAIGRPRWAFSCREESMWSSLRPRVQTTVFYFVQTVLLSLIRGPGWRHEGPEEDDPIDRLWKEGPFADAYAEGIANADPFEPGAPMPISYAGLLLENVIPKHPSPPVPEPPATILPFVPRRAA